MGTERNPRSQRSRGGSTAPPELQRIPLPPLPAFRRPAGSESMTRGVSGEEADLLASPGLERAGYSLPPGPGHEGRPNPLQESPAERAGVRGATILNDLVDEIEKDLEAEIERHSEAATLPAYRRSVGCSFDPVAGGTTAGGRRQDATPKGVNG